MRTWTNEEIKLLRKAYNNKPITALAAELGRTEQSIRSKVHIMRRKGFSFDKVTDAKY